MCSLNFSARTPAFSPQMVLEKCSERVAVWKGVAGFGDAVPKLIQRVLTLKEVKPLSINERTLIVQFLIVAFAGLEVDVVRSVRLHAALALAVIVLALYCRACFAWRHCRCGSL